MPCVCATCGCRADRPPGRPGELRVLLCADCGAMLCPRCGSHDLYGIVDGIVLVVYLVVSQFECNSP